MGAAKRGFGSRTAVCDDRQTVATNILAPVMRGAGQ